MMNAVCTVPGLLKLLLSKNHVNAARRLIIFVMDFFAVLMQCTVFGIVLASKYVFKSPSSTSTSQSDSSNSNPNSFDAGGAFETDLPTTENVFDSIDSDVNRFKRQLTMFVINHTASYLNVYKRSSGDFDDLFDNPAVGAAPPAIPTSVDQSNSKSNNQMFEDILSSFQIEWELPIALMLVSLVWWENFVDRDIKCGSYKLVNMKLLKENLMATRCKTNFISSLWKIIVTLLFAYMFHPGIFNLSKVFRTPDDPADNRFKYGGDFGMWGMNGMGAGNMMNQMPNGFGPMPPPPPPPLSLRKRSIYDAFNSTNSPYSFTLSANSSIFNHDQQNAYSILSNYSNMEILQAFTARQVFIPSMSTPSDIFNKQPCGEGSEEPVHDPTYKDRWITYLVPMILQVLSSALCYYTGRLACKLCMQRLGFALPLTLVTPVTLSVALIICKWFPESAVFQPDFVYWTCHEGYQTGSFKWQVICGLGLWWLSQLWIGGHVWFGKGQRLAFTERLFVLPGYCGILTEQSLMMNRRRYERADAYTVLDNKTAQSEEPQVSPNESIDSDMESKLKKDVNIVIYSCATMWHETETEMLQLLKSIMRFLKRFKFLIFKNFQKINSE